MFWERDFSNQRIPTINVQNPFTLSSRVKEIIGLKIHCINNLHLGNPLIISRLRNLFINYPLGRSIRDFSCPINKISRRLKEILIQVLFDRRF